MSDMPGPRPTPPPNAHERHDRLLIAQLVAGDVLEQGQRQDAQRFVATCPACAALAADLAAVSRAVAWEPMPRRRRDFRFDAQRAAELRGSSLQRFLRRLALPQSAALRPVAAGIMSVGLLVMVAGAVWPQGSRVATPVVAPVAPLASSAPFASSAARSGSAPLGSPAPMLHMEAPAAADTAPVGGAVPGEADDEADAARDTTNATSEGVSVTQEAAAAAPAADKVEEPAPEAQAGMAAEDGSARAKAMPSEPEATIVAEAQAAREQRGPSTTATPAAQAPVPAPTPAPASAGRDLPAAMIAPEATTSTAGDLPAAMIAPQASTSPGDTEGLTSDRSRADADVATTGDEASGQLAPVEDRSGTEGVLVIVGAALAVAGGSLLLLMWLGRRAADPLLR